MSIQNQCPSGISPQDNLNSATRAMIPLMEANKEVRSSVKALISTTCKSEQVSDSELEILDLDCSEEVKEPPTKRSRVIQLTPQ